MYLITNDYKHLIQANNLQQLTGGDDSILLFQQLRAQEEAISYLKAKYNTEQEFTDTVLHSPEAVYSAANRVYTVTEEAGSTKKTYALYFAKYPFPLFELSRYYERGTKCFWNGRIYTALSNSSYPDHEAQLQYGTYNNLPLANYIPDGPGGASFWGAGEFYTVPAGTEITNTQFWSPGDNRGQQILGVVIDIVLYYVHLRISPNQIPETRNNRYEAAIAWLKSCGKGDIDPNIPKRTPQTVRGRRISYGGNVKNDNSY